MKKRAMLNLLEAAVCLVIVWVGTYRPIVARVGGLGDIALLAVAVTGLVVEFRLIAKVCSISREKE